ncbi:MAG: phosphoribosylanthranilate isomerase [Muribaculaceae bacterium]|nr:phosphoribosylanthranilate isomerase [Muribaculaceae bacterium]
MKIKVCGLRSPENIDEVASLGIDMAGFIFYPRSPRFAGEPDRSALLRLRARGVEPVALFVDEDIDTVTEILQKYGFLTVQLHGDESQVYCDRLRERGFKVLKAISIAEAADIAKAEAYDGHADMLVLDTRCAGKGGSGRKFDWGLLEQAAFSTPFLLSGGIAPDDAVAVKELFKKMNGLMAGVDLNSKFETAPGLKSASLLSDFINIIKSQ